MDEKKVKKLFGLLLAGFPILLVGGYFLWVIFWMVSGAIEGDVMAIGTCIIFGVPIIGLTLMAMLATGLKWLKED